MNADWMKRAPWLANVSHFLTGMCVLLIAHTYSHSAHLLSIVSLAFTTVSFLKEFWFDLTYESGEDVVSSLIDFTGYILGQMTAWTLIMSAHAVTYDIP
jgi:hypothetical protein